MIPYDLSPGVAVAVAGQPVFCGNKRMANFDRQGVDRLCEPCSGLGVFGPESLPALYAVASVFVGLALPAVAAGLIVAYCAIPRATALRKAWLWVSVLPYSAYVLFGWMLGNLPSRPPKPLAWAAGVVMRPWHQPALALGASRSLYSLRAGDALKSEAVVVLGVLGIETLLWAVEMLVEAGLDRAFGPVDSKATDERRALRVLYDRAQRAERLALPASGPAPEGLRGYSRSGVRLSRNLHNAREAFAREQALWEACEALRATSDLTVDPDVFLLGERYARRVSWAWRQAARQCLKYKRADELGESLLVSAGLEPRLRVVHERLAGDGALESERAIWAGRRARDLRRSRWKAGGEGRAWSRGF